MAENSHGLDLSGENFPEKAKIEPEKDPKAIYRNLIEKVEELSQSDQSDSKTLEIVKRELEKLESLHEYYQRELIKAPMAPTLHTFDSEIPRLNTLAEIVQDFENNDILSAQKKLGELKKGVGKILVEEEEMRKKRIGWELADIGSQIAKLTAKRDSLQQELESL